ncbi:MAG: hypothetical protein JW745_00770 [Sedimentisphaerales bacterium]|nr:hypothetical protein [Sedimentisphaerales bacterium]
MNINAKKNSGLISVKITVWLLLLSLLATGGCNGMGYVSYVLFGSGQKEIKAKYAGLQDKKVMILLNTPSGMEYSYPQSRESIIIACMTILKEKVQGITFSDHEMIENYIARELDWISVPTDVLARKFGAERVIYVDMFEFTLQDSDSVGIYQGQVNAEVKVYETDSENRTKPIFNSYIDLKYPENHPVAATPDARYRILSGTIKLAAFEICKNFFDYKQEIE